jgi:hypothetical protein
MRAMQYSTHAKEVWCLEQQGRALTFWAISQRPFFPFIPLHVRIVTTHPHRGNVWEQAPIIPYFAYNL